MELVDEKHVHQCVSTEKADEITSAHDMKTELSEWFATHKGKKWESRGRKEGPLADPISFECAGGVRDKWMDVTVPNISVKVVVSRPQTLAFTKRRQRYSLLRRMAWPGGSYKWRQPNPFLGRGMIRDGLTCIMVINTGNWMKRTVP